MRKCYLDKIPVVIRGGVPTYDWKKSIGLHIPFEYDGVKDSFLIVGYEVRDKIYIEYQGRTTMVYGRFIRVGKIDKMFEKPINWYYQVGDVIKDNVNCHTRHLQITAKKYITNNKNPNYRHHKYYQYKCLICGYDCTMDDF